MPSKWNMLTQNKIANIYELLSFFGKNKLYLAFVWKFIETVFFYSYAYRDSNLCSKFTENMRRKICVPKDILKISLISHK